MTGTVLTNKGLSLITKMAAAKAALSFSRVAVGTGAVPSGYNPQNMIGLSEYKMDATIESYGVSPDQTDVAYLVAQISSIGVESGFAITEAGVYAEDPDEGEILYAYLDLTSDPQYIYAGTDAISKFAEITFNVIIGSVENVTAIVSPGALVKKSDFDGLKERVGELENPEFEDYTAEDADVPDARTAISEIKSKKEHKSLLSMVKAALMGLVTLGEMRALLVNNGLCEEAGTFFLDAAFGKNLQDQITKLNGDIQDHYIKYINTGFSAYTIASGGNLTITKTCDTIDGYSPIAAIFIGTGNAYVYASKCYVNPNTGVVSMDIHSINSTTITNQSNASALVLYRKIIN